MLLPAGFQRGFRSHVLNTDFSKSVLSKSVLSTWGNVSTPQAKYWYFRLKVAFTLDTEARGLLPFYANLVPGSNFYGLTP